MSVTALQSSQVPFYVSTDGITYKMIVCKRGIRVNINDNAVTTEDTDCGPITGLGSVAWSFELDAILNISPDAGTQESYEQILYWKVNQTLLYVRFNHPDSAGSNFKHEGQAYLTNLTGQVQQGNAMNFTATFTGSGSLTIS